MPLIDPPDDLNLANPPSNPALLDYLCQGFIRNGFDMKWLHRTIASSRTYQLSWRPNDSNRTDERNYSHAVVRRLPAEVVYDALAQATASDTAAQATLADPVRTRAIGHNSGLSGGKRAEGFAVNLFGRSPRVINCDCERSNEPSLLQTVFLRNDQDIYKLLDRPDGWLKQAAAAKTDPEEMIRQTYLRALNRPAEKAEIERGLRYIQESSSPLTGIRDLMWALLNTKEFILNR